MASEDSNGFKIPPGSAKAAAVAWTLPFTLVVPMVVAGGLGYFMDRWMHTRPLFLLK